MLRLEMGWMSGEMSGQQLILESELLSIPPPPLLQPINSSKHRPISRVFQHPSALPTLTDALVHVRVAWHLEVSRWAGWQADAHWAMSPSPAG